jgi:short-subunit dehydrogenase
MTFSLTGVHALLTGGSQGLGPYIARELAAMGVNVSLAARSADKLEAVAAEVRALGVEAAAFPADVTSAADRARLVQQAEAALGPIDILINNAGIMNNGAFARKTPDEIEATLHVNLHAPMLLTRAVLPGMLARRRGHIVNIASLAGRPGLPYSGMYGATKAALQAWSMALRMELEGTGVSVSTVSAGLVSEVGVFAVLNVRPHFMLGGTTPQQVARGVRRALERNEIDVFVNSMPLWTFQALYVVWPGLVLRLIHLFGVKRYWKRIYDGDGS